MSNKKRIILILIVLIVLSGCDSNSMNEKLQNAPNNQIGSYWESDNKKIYLYVESNSNTIGYILDDSIVPIFLSFAVRNDIVQVFQYNDDSNVSNNPIIEKWNNLVIDSSEHFSIMVKETTYFQEGEKMAFNQISQQEYDIAVRK